MHNKKSPRGKPYRLKNFDIKNKDKTTIEKISFNSDINYIDNINFMHNALEEVKSVFIKLEILKNKNEILQTFYTSNLNTLKLLHEKKILNQNELFINNNSIESVDVINNSFSKNKINNITETESLENDEEQIFVDKRFFILQNELKKILNLDDKIYYLNDFVKNIDKFNENFFFEMCHTELIYLIAEKLDDEEKSEKPEKTIGDFQKSSENIKNNIMDKEDLKNSNNQKDASINEYKDDNEEINKTQNTSDQSTSSIDDIKDVSKKTQTNQNESNDKKSKPFYTKIWFIATISITFAFLIIIVIYFALK
ncbi:hypothetical protein GVAV_001766 [Gurleya vavrai]